MSLEPFQFPAARIVARSRRQAMDWSLVLASQGIEHVLDHTPDSGWSLAVAETDLATAQAIIRQYRVENLRWPWQRTIPRTHEVFDWLAIAWVLLVLVFYALSAQRPALEAAGIMEGAAVAHGEWWRLFTATFLHADLAHLAANSIFGFILIGLAMGRYGPGLGLLTALVAGVGGNLLSWLVHGQSLRGLGASGVVMGALGLIAVPSLRQADKHPQTLRLLLGGLAAGLMLLVLLGTSPGTDVIAHFGGFLTGVVLGLALSRLCSPAPQPLTNLVAGILFAFVVLGTWWLALHHPR